VADQSLFKQAAALEQQIGGILSTFDVADLPHREKELIRALTQQLVDARLDARDYEYAETRNIQLRIAKEAKVRLELLQQTIIKASEYNIFGAVDVAELSARLQHIIASMD
jgi:hypothetical protein